MCKHSVRPFVYAVLLACSLAYSITSFALTLTLTAASGNQQVTLKWNAIESADYMLCRAMQTITDVNNCLTYTGGTLVNIAAGTTQFTVKKLSNSMTYYFRLKAKNATGTLAVSNLVTATPHRFLNDTGITQCANVSNNNLLCPVSGYPKQDAQSGRDVTQNDNSNGHAGFNFTKISSSGAILPADATNWNCIQDNVTGLMWEVKKNNNGLHDKDWTYSWYEPDNSKNGGDAGYQNTGYCDGTSACNTHAYVQAVNAAGWCGHKDWRLPDKAELISIIDYSRYNPAIDTAYFRNIINVEFIGFWSSSPYAFDSGFAWTVNTYHGNDDYYSKNTANAVRLVRGGQ